MEVAPGYKQSEVGVIPEDWKVQQLHTLAEKIMVGIASAATHAYRDRGVVMFRNQNIKPGYLDDSDVLYISDDYEVTFKNKRLKANDLITARTGYPGTTSVVPPQYDGAQSFTTLITRPKSALVDSQFLCWFINSEAGQRYFEQNQAGGGQKNVNAGSLKFLPVALPPTKKEQAAIAAALSDVDALIESLERLIAKKRALKQGAMHELLTGKRRLPGFDGLWSVVKAGEIGRFRGGSGFPVVLQGVGSGRYPFFKVSDMNNVGNETYMRTANNYISEEIQKQLGAPVFPADSIVFAKVGAAVFLERKRILAEASCIDNNMAALVLDRQKADCHFLHYLLLKTKLADLVNTTALPSLNRAVLAAIELTLPPIEEQSAIASVLSDMGAEIRALEAKLEKARMVKQGMMQMLLTGKVRLV